MVGGRGESLIPEKIKWALIMGLLTAFFCLYLADGVLMMRDNWYGWVVFGVAIVGLPILLRKKVDVKELWLVDFLLYASASGVLSLYFERIVSADHLVFLITDHGSMIMPATGLFELRTALCFCCIQSMIWILPTVIREVWEIGRKK